MYLFKIYLLTSWGFYFFGLFVLCFDTKSLYSLSCHGAPYEAQAGPKFGIAGLYQ